MGLLLSGEGELVAVGPGKAEVLVSSAAQFSPKYLVKGFKEDK